MQKLKSFPNRKARRAALISVSLALDQTPVYTARPRIRGYSSSASRGVPVYAPAFADTRRVHPGRDGQVELAGYVVAVRHPNTINRSRRI